MAEPQYKLQGIVRSRSEEMEDFEGPLDVIFLLLSRNKIEIQNVSITAILEQYLAYLDEMKRLDMEYRQRIHHHGIPLDAHQDKNAAVGGGGCRSRERTGSSAEVSGRAGAQGSAGSDPHCCGAGSR